MTFPNTCLPSALTQSKASDPEQVWQASVPAWFIIRLCSIELEFWWLMALHWAVETLKQQVSYTIVQCRSAFNCSSCINFQAVFKCHCTMRICVMASVNEEGLKNHREIGDASSCQTQTCCICCYAKIASSPLCSIKLIFGYPQKARAQFKQWRTLWIVSFLFALFYTPISTVLKHTQGIF